MATRDLYLLVQAVLDSFCIGLATLRHHGLIYKVDVRAPCE
jgi:hypothetical protein